MITNMNISWTNKQKSVAKIHLDKVSFKQKKPKSVLLVAGMPNLQHLFTSQVKKPPSMYVYVYVCMV